MAYTNCTPKRYFRTYRPWLRDVARLLLTRANRRVEEFPQVNFREVFRQHKNSIIGARAVLRSELPPEDQI